MNTTLIHLLRAATTLLLLAAVACSGEDRRSEQPFAPTVENVGTTVAGDSCLFTGRVTASPNSSLRSCGFAYGNDTLRLQTLSPEATYAFGAATRPLEPGTYFAVAFAENGIGRSYAPDTLYFEIK